MRAHACRRANTRVSNLAAAFGSFSSGNGGTSAEGGYMQGEQISAAQ